MNPYVRPLLGAFAAAVCSCAAAGELSYNRDVRPILSDKCFACHGPDDEERQADLRLDRRQDAIDGGALVPRDAEASELIRRILHDDPDQVMPPTSSGKPLTEAEKRTLRQWINTGAAYQRHWAFEPIGEIVVPETENNTWGRTPIDQFILQRLEQEGLSPSVAADRNTLIRRVYLDLIGLLPTPEEVQAFVRDDAPDAYERIVDRLLESRHYGERWGRHWLDQARYADSNGYTFDNARTMWPYRDWVIDALNHDMPFDRFTIEQLAGDLLPHPTRDQLIATGFHRNTLINEEGGTDDEQFRVETVIDRTNTTGSVWLAMTVGCAQCHNHKFDPISQEDYYRLYAFFNGTQDKNNRGPQILVQDPHADRISEIERQLVSLRKERDAVSKEEPSRDKKVQWHVLKAIQHASEAGAVIERLDDESLLVSGKNAIEESYHIRYQVDAEPLEKQQIAAIRLDVLPHASLPHRGPGRAANGNFVLADVRLADGNGNNIPLKTLAFADYSQPGHDVSRAVDDNPHTGWAINTMGKGNVAHWAQFTLAKPISIEASSELQLTLSCWQGKRPYNIGRFRVSASCDMPPNVLGAQSRINELIKQISDLIKEKRGLESKRVQQMVMRELAEPRPTHVLIRGDFLRPGRPVQPSPLAALFPYETAEERMTRLDLASWLVDSANPVTPRVVVNRVWQKYFGTGIVETVEDFGSQGTPPTHPELLDWLARQLVDGGWSLKRLHRLIVTSAAYRQASTVREELAAADPGNQLLGRQNRIRVDAEIVRDLALCASGKLSRKVGGPPVYPPQPPGVYAFTQLKKKWTTSVGEDRYRRTMYTFFYRSSPHPMLSTFDTPRFNVTCTRRSRSNTPLQSLMVANDAGMFELAEGLADRVLSLDGTESERINHAFRFCMCRPPDRHEEVMLGDFLRRQEEQFRAEASSSDAQRLAWVATARVLMNLDEFITRE